MCDISQATHPSYSLILNLLGLIMHFFVEDDRLNDHSCRVSYSIIIYSPIFASRFGTAILFIDYPHRILQ